MQIVTLEPDMPPYCSGNGMPRIPFSAKSLSMSFGYSAFSSISAARDRALFSRQLEGVKSHLQRGVGAVQLRHRGIAGEGAAAAAEPGSLVREEARRFEAHRHVGECEIVTLAPLAGASPEQGRGFVHRRLRDPKRLARDADPAGVKGAHRNR